MIGDNWLAEMFRPCFKKTKDDSYFMKEQFQVTSFCSSRYSDKNQNVLSRIINTVAGALNKEKLLPIFILIFLDDELIKYLNYANHRVVFGHLVRMVGDQY